jgi:hypothetical protein
MYGVSGILSNNMNKRLLFVSNAMSVFRRISVKKWQLKFKVSEKK